MTMADVSEKIHKKRGRKPKGGKIVKNEITTNQFYVGKKNVILHLKCKMCDLKTIQLSDLSVYNPTLCNVEPYEKDTSCELFETDKPMTEDKEKKDKESKMDRQKKIIYQKLSDLEKMLNTNSIQKKSACFWCTYDFDTQPIHIPSLFYKEKYNVYGCFCSPECACSHLFKEHIDDNTKYERYQLLNYLYGKIYNYEKNIRMAPNPYYTLEKFMGNLDIQEYRELLTYDRLLLVLDKPLTKIYPELHEDTNEFETMYDHKIVLRRTNKAEKNKIIQEVFHS
jgi:hypothetical protein